MVDKRLGWKPESAGKGGEAGDGQEVSSHESLARLKRVYGLVAGTAGQSDIDECTIDLDECTDRRITDDWICKEWMKIHGWCRCAGGC